MRQKENFFIRTVKNFLGNFFGMMRDHETPRRDKILIVLGLVYFLSPIDLIPEAVFSVFGLTDDLAVLWGTVSLIRKQYKRYVNRNQVILDVTDYK